MDTGRLCRRRVGRQRDYRADFGMPAQSVRQVWQGTDVEPTVFEEVFPGKAVGRDWCCLGESSQGYLTALGLAFVFRVTGPSFRGLNFVGWPICLQTEALQFSLYIAAITTCEAMHVYLVCLARTVRIPKGRVAIFMGREAGDPLGTMPQAASTLAPNDYL